MHLNLGRYLLSSYHSSHLPSLSVVVNTDQPPETPTTHNPDLGYNVHENVSFTQILNDESLVPSPSHVQQDSQQTGFESRTTNSSNKRARVSGNYEEYGTILQEIADIFRTMINTSTYSCLNKSLELLQEMLELGEMDAGMHLQATMLMEQPNKPVVFLKLLPTQRVPWLLAYEDVTDHTLLTMDD
ncbi:hypothetical protein EJ110_NYTH56435 [Nymphaea thermarum]|nr:hypothetical protein EJ110_NYTH56435 [Nymphaea thermarum]